MKKLKILIEQRKKINTLELEVDCLKNILKDNLYEKFMSNLKQEDDCKRIKSENKRLRLKIKKLQKKLEVKANV